MVKLIYQHHLQRSSPHHWCPSST